MAYNGKILKALESAIKHLEGSMSALKANNGEAFSNNIWHVAAELEYALSMFSLTVGNGHSAFLVKPNPEPKKLQTDQIILKVKDLINEAQTSMKNGDLIGACKNTRLARHYVFEVQEKLTGKKR